MVLGSLGFSLLGAVVVMGRVLSHGKISYTVGNWQPPYGIELVGALEVSDDAVGNVKVCVIDSGYSFGHPDLPQFVGNMSKAAYRPEQEVAP